MKFYKIGESKLKWNVAIMVILILLACSLMWILSLNFLNNLISYTDDTYGYYKSYYIAKAWLELSLTEIDNTDVWFSKLIDSWNAINANFNCLWCYFISNLQWKSSFISDEFWLNENCDNGTSLKIPAWWSITLPMFYDNSINFGELISYSNCLSWNNCENLLVGMTGLTLVSGDNTKQLGIWLVFLDDDYNISSKYLYMKNDLPMYNNIFLNYFNKFKAHYNSDYEYMNYLPYLILSNPDLDVEVSFCIKDNNGRERPTQKYFISSRGNYNWRVVWLQAIYQQPTPSFLINPYLDQNQSQYQYQYEY